MFFFKFSRNNVPVLIRAKSLVMVEAAPDSGSILIVETANGDIETCVDESPTEIYSYLKEIGNSINELRSN
jgi:hypothetical protein